MTCDTNGNNPHIWQVQQCQKILKYSLYIKFVANSSQRDEAIMEEEMMEVILLFIDFITPI